MKIRTLDSTKIVKTKEIQLRYLEFDDVTRKETIHYEVFAPDADVSDQSEEFQRVASAVWTDEVVAAYAATQAAAAPAAEESE